MGWELDNGCIARDACSPAPGIALLFSEPHPLPSTEQTDDRERECKHSPDYCSGRPVVRVQGRITLLIHLWLMVAMATCYSVFIALWLRTRVLGPLTTRAAFAGICRLTQLATSGRDPSNP